MNPKVVYHLRKFIAEINKSEPFRILIDIIFFKDERKGICASLFYDKYFKIKKIGDGRDFNGYMEGPKGFLKNKNKIKKKILNSKTHELLEIIKSDYSKMGIYYAQLAYWWRFMEIWGRLNVGIKYEFNGKQMIVDFTHLNNKINTAYHAFYEGQVRRENERRNRAMDLFRRQNYVYGSAYYPYMYFNDEIEFWGADLGFERQRLIQEFNAFQNAGHLFVKYGYLPIHYEHEAIDVLIFIDNKRKSRQYNAFLFFISKSMLIFEFRLSLWKRSAGELVDAFKENLKIPNYKSLINAGIYSFARPIWETEKNKFIPHYESVLSGVKK